MIQSEVKPNEVKPNGTKPPQQKAVDPKNNPLYFEVPMGQAEGLDCLTRWMQDQRKMDITAVGVRINDGRLMVGCLPTEGQ